MNHIEAMKQALEALELWLNRKLDEDTAWQAHTTLRQAIEQSEKQEPVAWWDGKESVVFTHDEIHTPNWTDYWTKPLYTTPQPQREWVGLTEDDIEAAYWQTTPSLERFARAIEAKLRSKNQ